jgi:four helix bundle protein
MAGSTEVKIFTDLEAWKIGRQLRKKVYEIATGLPETEKYGLGRQRRTAAISVTANIAEGFGRFHYQENIQFCRQARGSIAEIQDYLTVSLDQRYIPKKVYTEAFRLSQKAAKVLNGYIRMLNRYKQEPASK